MTKLDVYEVQIKSCNVHSHAYWYRDLIGAKAVVYRSILGDSSSDEQRVVYRLTASEAQRFEEATGYSNLDRAWIEIRDTVMLDDDPLDSQTETFLKMMDNLDNMTPEEVYDMLQECKTGIVADAFNFTKPEAPVVPIGGK